MNLYEDTNPRELKELLAQIHCNDTVLPDFQRDFVWDPAATSELIISIAQNYPAGSLLRIRNTHNLFAYREFEGAPPVNGKRPTFLILDGQQRLTSLYQAFYGVGENRYYLDIRRLLDGADFEDCIFNYRTSHPYVHRMEDEAAQGSELVLPLSVLRGGSGEFGRWSRRVARAAASGAARIDLEDRLSLLEERWIQVIDDYHFPVVTLTDTTSAEAVCTIFETLNRTGVKLSPFELLTARFWHQNLNLRELWSKARAAYPIIADFWIDPYYVLQIIGLLARPAPSIRRSDVMNLEKGPIENGWDDAIYGLQTALNYLQDECGVLSPGLVPYFTSLIPMSALFARTRHYRGPEVGAARDKIGRWFWCAVFGQRYESSPTAQAALDYTEGLSWLNGGPLPETVSAFRFDPAVLRETTARQRAVYRGVLALVLRNQARDFHSHRVLDLKVMQDNHVDDHHIFPNKYLERRGVSPRQRDCVLNHTLIDRATNQSIGDRAPSLYLKEILTARGEPRFTELLESHLLPAGPASPFWSDDFDDFLAARQDAVWAEIQNVTGLSAL